MTNSSGDDILIDNGGEESEMISNYNQSSVLLSKNQSTQLSSND